MPVAIIVNPLSGGATPLQGRRRAAQAAETLESVREAGEVFLTERRGHARELAAAAVRRGDRLVIAWGGDGTVNEVASALAFGSSSLGIVPSGSGNGLARELGVDRRPARAIGQALAAVPRTIDAGEIDGHLFFNIAGIGFDAHVAECFDREAGARRGLLTYVRLSVREMFTYEARDYRIDGRDVHRALLVTVANSGQWGNGARIAPGARLDDGRLDLVIFEERSRVAAIASIPRLFSGRFERTVGVTMRQIVQTTIEGDRPITFHVDGEPVVGGARLDVRAHPAALRVSVR